MTPRKLFRAAGLLAVAVLATLFAPAPAAHADAIQSGDGIDVGEFAYVFENDSWLSDLAACPTPAPKFVVLNIGSGQTDDVGHLDSIAQDIMSCGIKVYGYVDTNNMTRSQYDVALDVSRWVNPYNPERTVGGRMVDGIFYDRYPRDCGPIETPTNNTANDADYVLYGDSITDNVDDQFAFWSYPTPLIMVNVGTAVRGCHPGWTALSGHDMPDYYVTYENSYANRNTWAGGNLLTGGTFGTTYEDGNNYYPGKFVHIIYGESTMAETETAIDLADSRGASSVYVTTDTASNPYDVKSTYEAGARTYASLAHLGLRLDWNDFIPGIYSGTDYIGVIRQERAGNPCDNPGTPGTVERCSFPQQGLEDIYATADAACTGSWGTAGTAVSAHDISSTRVNCMMALVKDETGRDSIGVVSSAIVREYTDQDATNDESDAQDPDGSGSYSIDSTNSTILRLEFFDTYAKTEAMLVYARNRVVAGIQYADDYPSFAANCVIGRWDWTIPLPERICP